MDNYKFKFNTLEHASRIKIEELPDYIFKINNIDTKNLKYPEINNHINNLVNYTNGVISDIQQSNLIDNANWEKLYMSLLNNLNNCNNKINMTSEDFDKFSKAITKTNKLTRQEFEKMFTFNDSEKKNLILQRNFFNRYNLFLENEIFPNMIIDIAKYILDKYVKTDSTFFFYLLYIKDIVKYYKLNDKVESVIEKIVESNSIFDHISPFSISHNTLIYHMYPIYRTCINLRFNKFDNCIPRDNGGNENNDVETKGKSGIKGGKKPDIIYENCRLSNREYTEMLNKCDKLEFFNFDFYYMNDDYMNKMATENDNLEYQFTNDVISQMRLNIKTFLEIIVKIMIHNFTIAPSTTLISLIKYNITSTLDKNLLIQFVSFLCNGNYVYDVYTSIYIDKICIMNDTYNVLDNDLVLCEMLLNPIFVTYKLNVEIVKNECEKLKKKYLETGFLNFNSNIFLSNIFQFSSYNESIGLKEMVYYVKFLHFTTVNLQKFTHLSTTTPLLESQESKIVTDDVIDDEISNQSTSSSIKSTASMPLMLQKMIIPDTNCENKMNKKSKNNKKKNSNIYNIINDDTSQDNQNDTNERITTFSFIVQCEKMTGDSISKFIGVSLKVYMNTLFTTVEKTFSVSKSLLNDYLSLNINFNNESTNYIPPFMTEQISNTNWIKYPLHNLFYIVNHMYIGYNYTLPKRSEYIKFKNLNIMDIFNNERFIFINKNDSTIVNLINVDDCVVNKNYTITPRSLKNELSCMNFIKMTDVDEKLTKCLITNVHINHFEYNNEASNAPMLEFTYINIENLSKSNKYNISVNLTAENYTKMVLCHIDLFFGTICDIDARSMLMFNNFTDHDNEAQQNDTENNFDHILYRPLIDCNLKNENFKENEINSKNLCANNLESLLIDDYDDDYDYLDLNSKFNDEATMSNISQTKQKNTQSNNLISEYESLIEMNQTNIIKDDKSLDEYDDVILTLDNITMLLSKIDSNNIIEFCRQSPLFYKFVLYFIQILNDMPIMIDFKSLLRIIFQNSLFTSQCQLFYEKNNVQTDGKILYKEVDCKRVNILNFNNLCAKRNEKNEIIKIHEKMMSMEMSTSDEDSNLNENEKLNNNGIISSSNVILQNNIQHHKDNRQRLHKNFIARKKLENIVLKNPNSPYNTTRIGSRQFVETFLKTLTDNELITKVHTDAGVFKKSLKVSRVKDKFNLENSDNNTEDSNNYKSKVERFNVTVVNPNYASSSHGCNNTSQFIATVTTSNGNNSKNTKIFEDDGEYEEYYKSSLIQLASNSEFEKWINQQDRNKIADLMNINKRDLSFIYALYVLTCRVFERHRIRNKLCCTTVSEAQVKLYPSDYGIDNVNSWYDDEEDYENYFLILSKYASYELHVAKNINYGYLQIYSTDTEKLATKLRDYVNYVSNFYTLDGKVHVCDTFALFEPYDRFSIALYILSTYVLMNYNAFGAIYFSMILAACRVPGADLRKSVIELTGTANSGKTLFVSLVADYYNSTNGKLPLHVLTSSETETNTGWRVLGNNFTAYCNEVPKVELNSIRTVCDAKYSYRRFNDDNSMNDRNTATLIITNQNAFTQKGCPLTLNIGVRTRRKVIIETINSFVNIAMKNKISNLIDNDVDMNEDLTNENCESIDYRNTDDVEMLDGENDQVQKQTFIQHQQQNLSKQDGDGSQVIRAYTNISYQITNRVFPVSQNLQGIKLGMYFVFENCANSELAISRHNFKMCELVSFMRIKNENLKHKSFKLLTMLFDIYKYNMNNSDLSILQKCLSPATTLCLNSNNNFTNVNVNVQTDGRQVVNSKHRTFDSVSFETFKDLNLKINCMKDIPSKFIDLSAQPTYCYNTQQSVFYDQDVYMRFKSKYKLDALTTSTFTLAQIADWFKEHIREFITDSELEHEKACIKDLVQKFCIDPLNRRIKEGDPKYKEKETLYEVYFNRIEN